MAGQMRVPYKVGDKRKIYMYIKKKNGEVKAKSPLTREKNQQQYNNKYTSPLFQTLPSPLPPSPPLQYLDGFLPVGHDDGAKSGVLGVDLRVIHRPEPVEHEVLLVPGGRVLHLQVGLVADDVVDEVQACGGSVRGSGGEVEG